MTTTLGFPHNQEQALQADLIHMSFKNTEGDIFYPGSNFVEGRNALLRLALAWEYGQGEHPDTSSTVGFF